MIPSRRDNLTKAKLDTIKPSHAGLWLDRYMEQQLRKNERVEKGQQTPMQQLVNSVAQIRMPNPIYPAFYERWKHSLEQNGVKTCAASVRGRMVVGLGAESVLETSVALHRTYGVPYIPGSALKGLAAAYAHQRLKDPQWRKSGVAHQVLFGDTTTAGYITFFDALYIPGSQTEDKPLSPDVITVHHPKYYQSGQSAPADWDSPTPIPFLSATGSYLVALGASPGAEMWRDSAFEILAKALEQMGIGAKTSSGYGRLSLEAPNGKPVKAVEATTKPAAPVDPDQVHVNTIIQQVKQLRSSDVAGQIANYAVRCLKLEVAAPLKRELAQVILDKVIEVKREQASAEKAWYQALVAYLAK